jgi:drug/metabolite transporter (DMT)-like permease
LQSDNNPGDNMNCSTEGDDDLSRDTSITASCISRLVEHDVPSFPAGDNQNSAVNYFQVLRDAVKDELEHAHDGDILLEMSLTRSSSMPPNDLVSLASDGPLHFSPKTEQCKEGNDEDKNSDYDDQSSHTAKSILIQDKPQYVPWYAYLLLTGTVVALASFGPVLALQIGVSGSMKTMWRHLLTAFLFFPFMAWEIRKHGVPVLNATQWGLLAFACAIYAGMGVGFVTALEYASVGICVILANSQCLILLLGKVCVGSPITVMEAAGALVAFSGTIIVSVDSEASNNGSSSDSDGSDSKLWLGILLAFVFAGCGGVGYLISAKIVRTQLPLFTFMFTVMLGGCVFILPFQKFVLGEKITFDRDIDNGIWGFLNWRLDRLPNDLIQVLLGNFVGTVGQIACMQFFDPLIITVACLMQPVVAEFMASAVGVSPLPGWVGWIGNAAVIGGTLLVVIPSSTFPCYRKSETPKKQLGERLVAEQELV